MGTGSRASRMLGKSPTTGHHVPGGALWCSTPYQTLTTFTTLIACARVSCSDSCEIVVYNSIIYRLLGRHSVWIRTPLPCIFYSYHDELTGFLNFLLLFFMLILWLHRHGQWERGKQLHSSWNGLTVLQALPSCWLSQCSPGSPGPSLTQPWRQLLVQGALFLF